MTAMRNDTKQGAASSGAAGPRLTAKLSGIPALSSPRETSRKLCMSRSTPLSSGCIVDHPAGPAQGNSRRKFEMQTCRGPVFGLRRSRKSNERERRERESREEREMRERERERERERRRERERGERGRERERGEGEGEGEGRGRDRDRDRDRD